MVRNSLQREGTSWRSQIAATAFVAPLILAPGIAIGAMFWARAESIRLYPDVAAARPPTVSRAIADPQIGDIFAIWMLVVAACQAFAVYRLALAFGRTTLSIGSRRHRAIMTTLFAAILLAQAVAIVGVVTLSQYTGSISDYLHQLGSYMMFVGNGLAILLSGVFVWLDDLQRSGREKIVLGTPLPYFSFVHTRLAAVVSVFGVIFGFLFFAFDLLASMNDYFFRLSFAMVEVVLLDASLIYLGSFVVSMYRYERFWLSRPCATHETKPAHSRD